MCRTLEEHRKSCSSSQCGQLQTQGSNYSQLKQLVEVSRFDSISWSLSNFGGMIALSETAKQLILEIAGWGVVLFLFWRVRVRACAFKDGREGRSRRLISPAPAGIQTCNRFFSREVYFYFVCPVFDFSQQWVPKAHTKAVFLTASYGMREDCLYMYILNFNAFLPKSSSSECSCYEVYRIIITSSLDGHAVLQTKKGNGKLEWQRTAHELIIPCIVEDKLSKTFGVYWSIYCVLDTERLHTTHWDFLLNKNVLKSLQLIFPELMDIYTILTMLMNIRVVFLIS